MNNQQETLKQLFREIRRGKIKGMSSDKGKKLIIELNQNDVKTLHDARKYIYGEGIQTPYVGDRIEKRLLARIDQLDDFVMVKLGSEKVSQLETYARMNGFGTAEEYIKDYSERVIRNAFTEG